MWCLLAVSYSSLSAADKPVKVSSADISLAASLQEREQALAKKDKELVAREQKNRELKREIDEKLARLSELQREINEKLDEMKKVQDADFPAQPFEEIAYHCRFRGQKSYNGVAILSKTVPQSRR